MSESNANRVDDPVNQAGSFTPTDRTRLRRRPKRGSYDRAVIHAILDEAVLAHVAFTVAGVPYTLPMAYARHGDALYLHGARANRMLGALQTGAPACVTATLLDGLVLARSAFHQSVSYRCVVAIGRASEVTDPGEHLRALHAIVEHVIPGRWRDVRPPNEHELAQTLVLRFEIEEASAKLRDGAPVDDPEDYALDVWAGTIPLRLVPSAPIADARLTSDAKPPAYALEYRRPGAREGKRSAQ